MKTNKSLLLFCIILTLSGAATQHAMATRHPAQTSEYADSTFTITIKQSDRITVRTSLIHLTIRRWDEAKAHLVVTAAPADWEDDLLVSVRPTSGGILVELTPKPHEGDHNVQLSKTWSTIKATLDIPDGHEFDLESSFTDVEILSDFKRGNFRVNNGELTAASIADLELNAQFAKVHLNDCHTGDITQNNGELTAANIQQLKLNTQFSKVRLNASHEASVTSNNTTLRIGTVDVLQLGATFSNVDLTTVGQLKFNSQNDELVIGDLGAARGRKTFGSFRIAKLRKSFSLIGQNADVTLEDILVTVDTVKIDDRFAKLQIPIDGFPGLSLHFDGRFATVDTRLPTKALTDRNEMNHTEFTIDKGDGSGKLPLVDLRCDNCEVDLRSL